MLKRIPNETFVMQFPETGNMWYIRSVESNDTDYDTEYYLPYIMTTKDSSGNVLYTDRLESDKTDMFIECRLALRAVFDKTDDI